MLGGTLLKHLPFVWQSGGNPWQCGNKINKIRLKSTIAFDIGKKKKVKVPETAFLHMMSLFNI